MRRSKLTVLICLVSLLALAVGCSDDDDDLATGGMLNPAVVSAGLGEAIPAAVEVPVVVIDIVTPFLPIPATRGIGPLCSGNVAGVCTSGTLSCSPGTPMTTFNLTFNGCVVDGIMINGTASLASLTGTLTFLDGFTADGDPLSGQIQITPTGTGVYSALFSALSLAVDAGRSEISGGPMSLDTIGQVVNATNLAVFLDGSPAFPPFSSNVTIVNNLISAMATDTSTTPPTIYNCSGTLSYNGGVSTSLVCE